MAEPWIGDASDATPGTCAFAIDEGDPPCGAMASTHVSSESAIHGVVALPTCDRHVAVARAAGPYLEEHSFGPGCAARESLWYGDHCEAAR